jgi:hypothetical protein
MQWILKKCERALAGGDISQGRLAICPLAAGLARAFAGWDTETIDQNEVRL